MTLHINKSDLVYIAGLLLGSSCAYWLYHSVEGSWQFFVALGLTGLSFAICRLSGRLEEAK
jgi:hypothetical protein